MSRRIQKPEFRSQKKECAPRRHFLTPGFWILPAAACAAAAFRSPDVPHGMYFGGNQLVRMGSLRAGRVTGAVVDRAGAVVPGARVQVQVRGSDKILENIPVNEKGHFHLPRLLRPGSYWLGVSGPGFNLHFWELQIDARASKQSLRVELSVGT